MSIAVLTGDIVESTALSADNLSKVFETLSTAAEDIAGWQNESTRFTRSRGDGWQLCLTRPGLALRAALYIKAKLKALGTKVETRIAIAEGDGAAMTPSNLNEATGPAYTASGRMLDSLTGPATMAHAAGGATGAVVRLADEISRHWTQAQARSLALMLPPDPPTRAEAGKALGISRQAVDQALAGAGYGALDDAMTMLEERR